MSASDTPSGPGGFDSLDTAVIVNDEPGDTTVRPIEPPRLQLVLAERERLRRFKEARVEPPPPDVKSGEGEAGKNGG